MTIQCRFCSGTGPNMLEVKHRGDCQIRNGSSATGDGFREVGGTGSPETGGGGGGSGKSTSPCRSGGEHEWMIMATVAWFRQVCKKCDLCRL